MTNCNVNDVSQAFDRIYDICGIGGGELIGEDKD